MIARVLAWLVERGFSGLVDRALTHVERRAELLNDSEKVRAEATVELARQAVAEAQIMADFNAKKLAFPWFWIFAGAFLVPLAFWWTAVIVDSVFMFDWNVADLPTPQMQAWAGDMIRWVFYVGTGAGAVKALIR